MSNEMKRGFGRKIAGGFGGLYGLFGGVLENIVEKASMGKFDLAALWFMQRLEKRYKDHSHPLLKGDLFEYAKREYPPQSYPTAWVRIPEDMRRPLPVDGRLLNGRDVAELAKAEIKETDVIKAFILAGRRSIVVAVLLLLFVAWPLAHWLQPHFQGLIYFTAMVWGGDYQTAEDYPQWAADSGAWLPVISWYVLDFVRICWSSLMNVLVFIVPFLLLIPVIWTFAFSAGLNRLWQNLSAPLRAATRDTKVYWMQNMMLRQQQYTVYCRQVWDAIYRLGGQDLIPLGRATGIARSRGDNKAPVENQLVAFDAEAFGKHLFGIAPTGERKTRGLIIPLVKGYNAAVWDGVKKGVLVMDGKGNLWQTLRHLFADRDDVRIIGTNADQYGVDLMKGMTPLDVSTTFVSINRQLAASSNDSFWPKAAGAVIMKMCAVLRVLDMDKATRDEWINDNGHAPYSIMAINVLCDNDEKINEAVDKFRAIQAQWKKRGVTLAEEDILDEAFEAAEYFIGAFDKMAMETKGSMMSHIVTTIGFFSGHREAARRFCSGSFDEAKTIDVDHALQGGVVMVDIGEIAHGIVGQIVTTWLKTRLYILANRRLVEEGPEACKKTMCLFVADEFHLLVTTGKNSDETFWSTSREASVFLLGATQSVSSLISAIGRDATMTFLQLMRNKVIAKVEDPATIEYVNALQGQVWRGMETENGFYATHAIREKVLGKYGAKTVALDFLSGFLPARFTSATSQRNAFNRDYKLGQHDSALQTHFRMEDKEKDAVFGNLNKGPKFDFEELALGQGMAWAMFQRAGVERTDIVDLYNDAA